LLRRMLWNLAPSAQGSDQPTMYDAGTVDGGLHLRSSSHAGSSSNQNSEIAAARPSVAGKFLRAGSEKLWVKGVTYGTFESVGDEAGSYPEARVVESDFVQMVAAGINSVRVYTVPPVWLLDTALKLGLRVMVGLPWEQHIAFLDEPNREQSIIDRVQQSVRACARHPAILCFVIGNEIPASIVRWHGRRRVERFIRTLYDVVKQEDPQALVTYVNFPTTEYLQLPFLDIVCFNVYLESEDRLAAYLARLQNIAGERPLLLTEIGLDSRRNGIEVQATSLIWQLRTTFAAGCAGAFVFGWTDEWHRGGYAIEDWDFGLTTRSREPKPALPAVRAAYAEIPFARGMKWPRVSVVVCSYNGARTIRDTLEGLKRLDYPDFEVIVVNDGSKDTTPDIAAEYDVRLISTENRGLSSARNTGWQAATGEIVAYIDDDAYPDAHWLQYLAYVFMTTDHVGVGGPNIAPPGDGPIADCVANAPGGPVHVLLTDTQAEHIPGCNMAFRRSALADIGGFDPRYRAAGDDVDLCWRLIDRDGTIGFHPGAMDWHHRRNSVAMYWRQQIGYGKAEALLEEKWPERYNAIGHLVWSGRLYGKGITEALRLGRWQIYHGTWGTAAYQSLYETAPPTLMSLPLMPEWYLVILALAGFTALGATWAPIAYVALPLLLVAVTVPIVHALSAASRAHFPTPTHRSLEVLAKHMLTALMHLMQPAARLVGRLQHGLSPWRRRGAGPARLQWRGRAPLWSERWATTEDWLRCFEAGLREQGAIVLCGGHFARWDLHVRGGLFGAARGLVAVEEHGGGKQVVRVSVRPWTSAPVATGVITLSALSLIAFADGAGLAGSLLAILSGGVGAAAVRDCARAAGLWSGAIERLRTTALASGR
jgi:glycosyltransferase involved in cell wall biosynthesis